MEISKNFDHRTAAERWYEHWNKAGYFHSEPDERKPYTIVMPPPNVTGVLHMGHALNNTVQDVLIRRAKMSGYNTCWVPGTDHASIATEAKVVGMLREKGIDKNKLTRDEFLGHAWEWKEKYGGIILQQLRKLGCSLDWQRTAFTMDKEYYASVIRVFVELYNKGLIYRGVKMINWDPKAKTALSDEEVVHKQTQSKLYYVRYRIEGETDEWITIATVRPETILGDTAVCVHPEDPRYAHLRGKHCFVPLLNRRIPVIFDEYIDREFGTGALKVTPAHDINDYNLGLKHRLPVIDTLNEDGTLSEAAGLYIGEDRFAVRKQIVKDLEAAGHLVKEEPYSNQVGFSERTDVVIEPRLSMQWWCNMEGLAKPALESVLNDTVGFYPPKFKNLYRHWMENIKDWCVSRQLWWGQRIPAWYDTDGNIYVAETEEDAVRQYKEKNPGASGKLRQDEDVLDTWFSSWLWPMQVFGWNESPDNPDLNYYYPTQTLVTAPEIIFFWVARMIMAGYEFKGEHPFERVYFTGIVRDKQGRKMSKSLGNSPDLLQLIDDYGADAVRLSVLISSPAGNDVLFDEAALEQGRNFCNKIWNALKLVKGWEARIAEDEKVHSGFALDWMDETINAATLRLKEWEGEFKLSESLKLVYSLIWNDFCSWYLEWVKPAQESPVSREVYERTVGFFEKLLQLLHPYMPFITEEAYHLLGERTTPVAEPVEAISSRQGSASVTSTSSATGDDLMASLIPEMDYRNDHTAAPAGSAILTEGNLLQEIITAVRDARVKNQLKSKDPVSLRIDTANPEFYEKAGYILRRQVNADEITFAGTALPGGQIALVVQTEKIYIEAAGGVIDTAAQKAEMEKELVYLRGFLSSVEKKLGNERFVQNAKAEVVDAEKKKQADALAKIQAIEESLSLLS